MASNINRVFVTGRLTRDSELRSTQGGTSILSIGLAVNDRRKNPSTGEWEDVPNYVDCIVFGNRANGLAPYLTKGTKVAIEGKLRWSSWEKDGQRRSKIEVIVDELELLSGNQQQAPRAPQAPSTAPQMPQNAPQVPQGYQSAPMQQMSPQTAPQAPQGYVAAVPQQQYQQPMPQAQSMPLYDEDIPF